MGLLGDIFSGVKDAVGGVVGGINDVVGSVVGPDLAPWVTAIGGAALGDPFAGIDFAGFGGAADAAAGGFSFADASSGFGSVLDPGNAWGIPMGDVMGTGSPTMTPSFGQSLLNQFSGPNGIKNIAQLGSSLYGLSQGNQLKQMAGTADPFSPYRGMFAQQLSSLMANPSMVTQLPGYQANMQAAEQALTRNLAAQGLTGSGTAAEALAKFGAQYQGQAFQQELSNLSTLAGAGSIGAGGAGQLFSSGQKTINQSLDNMVKMIPGG